MFSVHTDIFFSVNVCVVACWTRVQRDFCEKAMWVAVVQRPLCCVAGFCLALCDFTTHSLLTYWGIFKYCSNVGMLGKTKIKDIHKIDVISPSTLNCDLVSHYKLKLTSEYLFKSDEFLCLTLTRHTFRTLVSSSWFYWLTVKNIMRVKNETKHQAVLWCSQSIYCIFILTVTEREETLTSVCKKQISSSTWKC